MKKIFWFMLFFMALGSIPGACGAGYVALQVYSGDYSQFAKQRILEILSKETILYYADGVSQLGSLFGQEHRIYVSIDRIPQVMKDAIVSAEDEDFYTNIGIDPKGILRAAIHNLIFRSRQGASTITQQTVKNLYGRKETDLFTKFKEMINAFKLEKMYSKEQILEFYLNQFHVTGNGRGVGVASKYYFNKDVDDLDLVEAAFIAGSVKGPEKYNPFTKISVESREKAKQQAFIRKNYVLERMLKSHKITQEQYDVAAKEQIPFNQGRFQYNEISVNQTVQKQLSRPEILQAIGANTMDEIGTMGLRITTTLDKDIQSAAQYGLRQNLSAMQMTLKGFEKEPSSSFVNIQKPELHSFYDAHVVSVDATPSKESVQLNFGVLSCLVDTESVNRVAIKTDQVSHSGLQKSKTLFLHSIHAGDTVLASVKKIESDGSLKCDLETHPKIQGATIVLDKGKIMAMAGGFASNEYNRALYAERQPGSTFKIPTYYAALQMGWSVLDSIPNMRDVFLWQGNYYFPRPDHPPQTLETTVLGAGARSENLASIWILEHMLDKLNYNQFQDLLRFLNVIKDSPNSQQTLSLIAKKFNASPNNIPYIYEGILNRLKGDLVSDFNVMNSKELRVFVRTLHYGNDFDKQQDIISSNQELDDKEKKFQVNILKNNVLRWEALEKKAQLAVERLQAVAQGTEAITESDRELFSSFALNEEAPNVISYQSSSPWLPELVTPLLQPKKYNSISIESLILMAKSNPESLNFSNVLLDGVVPISLVQSIRENIEKTYNEVKTKEPLERLFWNSDFLYSLGMYYTASMVNSMGVSEPLQWVPSFPLGSNAVTLVDLSLMFQTFLQGKMYRYFNMSQPNQLLIIKRIEDINGNLLWQSKPKEYSFQDSFFSTPILNTLRGTVTAGTAYLKLNGNVILRSADENVDKLLRADKITVPSFGKTGTTNNYTNGTYIGFLPYPQDKGDNLSPQNAYTIATYVGYDSNQPMIRKWFKALGSSAIPAWQEVAQEIIVSQNYADKLNWQDLAKSGSHLIPFYYGSGLSRVVVPVNSGVSVSAQGSDPDDPDSSNDIYASDYTETGRHTFTVYLDGSASDDIFVPKRKVSFYAPFVYVPQDKNSKLDLKNQDQPVTPAPMAEKAPDSLKSEPTDSPSSLPPPPPSIQ